MRNRQTIEKEIAEIFSQNLHIDVPSYDSDLFETGILDSLQLVELLFQLEQQFGVCVSMEETDLEDFRSIHHISAMLASQNGEGLNRSGLDFREVAKTEKLESTE